MRVTCGLLRFGSDASISFTTEILSRLFSFLFRGVQRGYFSRFNAGKSLRPQVQETLLQKAVATQRQPGLQYHFNAMGRIRQFHLRSVWSSLGKAGGKN